MEFKKNELINQTLEEYKETWAHTLDTGEFINEKSLNMIDKYIHKNLVKKFKEIDVFHLLFLQEKGFKLDIFQKLKISFSGLKPLYLEEKKEIERQEKLQRKIAKQKELEKQKRLQRRKRKKK